MLYIDSFYLGITGKNNITDVATKTATSIMVTKNINLLDLISFNTKNLLKVTPASYWRNFFALHKK